MKKYCFSLLVLSSLFLYSCQDKEESASIKSQPKESTASCNIKALYSSSHKIKQNEAEQYAIDALTAANKNGLKSGKALKVGKVEAFITSNSLRFNLASSISDTLAYIVNFADSAGFAYVAADDRVVYPVLAFFENTNIDKQTISSKPELAYMIERTNNYIANAINSFEENKDAFLAQVEKAEKEGSFSKSQLRASSSSTITDVMTPLITTTWGQGSYYNGECGQCTTPGCTNKAVTGCAATAFSQILNVFRYPAVINGTTISWNTINSTSTSSVAQMVRKKNTAILMKNVAIALGTDFHCGAHGGSGANPEMVTYWSNNNGFVAQSSEYDWTNVKNFMRSYNRPVFIYGYATEGGHGWAQDGYRTMTINIPIVLIGKTIYHKLNVDFVHNNWGWEGNCNGYFISGSFDTQNAQSYDSNSHSASYNFESGVHAITIRR